MSRILNSGAVNKYFLLVTFLLTTNYCHTQKLMVNKEKSINLKRALGY